LLVLAIKGYFMGRYNYLLSRVEYPIERGYRIETTPLPDWIYVVITKQGDDKYLTVRSRIHMNKEVRIGPTYSVDFSDWDILKDLSGEISKRFL
jgi:hypothetical protein